MVTLGAISGPDSSGNFTLQYTVTPYAATNNFHPRIGNITGGTTFTVKQYYLYFEGKKNLHPKVRMSYSSISSTLRHPAMRCALATSHVRETYAV